MNTKQIADLANEAVTRKTGSSWITTDGIEITEGVKSGSNTMMMIECRECGTTNWDFAINLSNRLEAIRAEFH